MLDEAISIARKKAELHKESADAAYGQADKEPKTIEDAMHLMEANIATEFTLLYKMIVYNMESASIVTASIEDLIHVIEKLGNESDTTIDEVHSIRDRLTSRLNEKLGPLKDEFDRWSIREKRLGEAGAL
jgi:hypothetical protein